MKKTAVVTACWLAFLSPLAARAADVDYPALGIRLTNLPETAKPGRLNASLQAHGVYIQFGAETTSAEIARFDKAVSEGSIADALYRDALSKQLGIQEPTGRINKPVTIAGQLAWMTGSAQGFGPLAMFRATFYLVVSQHLYEIAVSATGKKELAASSFDAATRAIVSGIVFEPVQPQPDKPLAPDAMPPFLMGTQRGPYYSDRARRLGEAGIVMVKFNIDGSGAARSVTLAGRADADLAQSAVSIVQGGRFKVPQGWDQSEGSKQAYTLEFRFVLSCLATQQLPQIVPDPDVVTICGTILER